jgi:hypothetical protein
MRELQGIGWVAQEQQGRGFDGARGAGEEIGGVRAGRRGAAGW